MRQNNLVAVLKLCLLPD